MRVAFFPYGLQQENPYQNQIIKGLEANNVTVVKIPGRKLFPLLQIARLKPDIVHIFWPHDFYIGKNILTAWFKRFMLLITLPVLSKYPSVYSADNLISHGIHTHSAAVEKKWISKILRRCKGIVFMSKAAEQIYTDFYGSIPKQKLIIPHVSFTDNYPNTLTPQTARASLSINNEIVFCMFGRIEPYKGVIEVIEAFIQLNNTDTILLICGKCNSLDYYNQLKLKCGKLYQNRIRIINEYIPDNEVQRYLNSADFLVLNYVDTPLNPGTAILAKTFNLPLIAPKTPVLEEVLSGNDTIFFEQANTDTLIHALQIASARTPNRNRILGARADAEPSQIGEKLKHFYERILQQVKS